MTKVNEQNYFRAYVFIRGCHNIGSWIRDLKSEGYVVYMTFHVSGLSLTISQTANIESLITKDEAKCSARLLTP